MAEEDGADDAFLVGRVVQRLPHLLVLQGIGFLKLVKSEIVPSSGDSPPVTPDADFSWLTWAGGTGVITCTSPERSATDARRVVLDDLPLDAVEVGLPVALRVSVAVLISQELAAPSSSLTDERAPPNWLQSECSAAIFATTASA